MESNRALKLLVAAVGCSLCAAALLAGPPAGAQATWALRATLVLTVMAMNDSAATSALPFQIEPRHYLCYRASGPIDVDGKLDKAAWLNAPWTEDFVDIEGSAKPKPRLRTRAKLLWDDQYLYVGAELEEPNVWATLTQHDSVIFQDPDFEVFIDPDGDNHDYYEIEINALATEWDLRLDKPYKDGGSAHDEWEILGLKKAVHVYGTINDPGDRDRGWSVEFAFPWSVLAEYAKCPCPPKDGDQWRIDFSRVEWDVYVKDGNYIKYPGRPEHNWVWSPQGAINMHRPETWGCVQFSTAPPGKGRFQPDPAAPTRAALMRIYYAQRAFHAEHSRWATSLADLELAGLSAAGMNGHPAIAATADGYEATARCRSRAGAVEQWHVRQDSLLWTTALSAASP